MAWHLAIQSKGDVVSVIKNQNIFTQDMMLHFISIVLKTVTNIRKEYLMNVIGNAFSMSSSTVLKILLTITFV